MTSTDKMVDYLVIGHVTRDLRGETFNLGGTAAYAGLTAAALGRQVGIVTSCETSLDLSWLASLQIVHAPSGETTTFENEYSRGKRDQRIHSIAAPLNQEIIPSQWDSTSLVHLAPVANEVDLGLFHHFEKSFLGITPQGWMRTWDRHGKVHFAGWEPLIDFLPLADAVVISIEDLQGDEGLVQRLASQCQVLAVTRSSEGASIHVGEEVITIPAPSAIEVDPTGSGDIFAAAFFIRLQESGDPLHAGQYATRVATSSISDDGLASVPTQSEISAIQDSLRL